MRLSTPALINIKWWEAVTPWRPLACLCTSPPNIAPSCAVTASTVTWLGLWLWLWLWLGLLRHRFLRHLLLVRDVGSGSDSGSGSASASGSG